MDTLCKPVNQSVPPLLKFRFLQCPKLARGKREGSSMSVTDHTWVEGGREWKGNFNLTKFGFSEAGSGTLILVVD